MGGLLASLCRTCVDRGGVICSLFYLEYVGRQSVRIFAKSSRQTALDMRPSGTLLQLLHYYGTQSWAQTKSHQQHDRVRRSRHPVMGCQVVTRTVDTSIACRVILPSRNDPVTPNRALRTSTITRAYIGTQIMNHYFKIHSYHSSPYDLLPDGTVVE